MNIDRLDFSLAKAEYLLSHTARPGEGGDKRKFWYEVMGFRASEALREAILTAVTIEQLQVQAQTPYGERYQADVLIQGPSGAVCQVRTGWIVRTGEEVARFVTAFPHHSRRQQ